MDPVAFELFGIEVMWYGILISSGIIIGAILAFREARRINFDEETLIDLLLYAIPLSIVGARIYYVAFSWDYYSENLKEIFHIRGGGLAIHGAIAAAVIVAVIFCKRRKVNFWKVVDICAPSIILGQAIGRWGNYINQEAHGGPTDLPWGIIVDGVKVHPTFLYESLWNFAVFFYLIWYRKNKQKVTGETFLLYLILYSVGRFFIEGLRTDSLMLGPIRVAQLVSMALIGISIVIFSYRRKKINRI
ncbi:prolipoprotein diacylglyceryl transferase [Anaerosalibacter bizertensis]|uniref:Phosphatidylglycerol--prolipoprotein diacylglyceryl transferase n=1 Tax=Anaerosalibacter bizertensis TaxID=932217 RepID=A0A844FI00_9FIRM|nr:prolipoprotein diacylglyceryl transferase [Anaerosalibacter bizertensis]MBV1817792.1 prolipoprotein diacylglyceryl transferase [Bacteroidales bacterium MSK.15.36]MBU5292711.1 prolipoprotein diacylglyceryl transferase [Anaerosalibacter bizertensis]MCB5559159.1 prolipoprotein diacylglyceryl transferase [Anaerosalibacter bizertensis]MCG4564502.1 prolipoprotein diacylglyceryl transferase [Anaerosalibacter bizertensis]MCG4581392.1 prolipoprotein diacylglyceryl transferase [Anaerosalibacter bizer